MIAEFYEFSMPDAKKVALGVAFGSIGRCLLSFYRFFKRALSPKKEIFRTGKARFFMERARYGAAFFVGSDTYHQYISIDS
jgi:hypothetical protein